MDTSPNKKTNNDYSSYAGGFALLAFVAVAVFFTHENQIIYTYKNNCEKLFFAGWILILYFTHTRLKSGFENSKNDRKSLLKLKALRGQSKEAVPFATRNGLVALKDNNPHEIKIGTRLKDGRPIYLSDEKRTTQIQILGATGRGKTESVILPWMVQDFRVKKNPVVLIDGKGDPEIAKRFQKYVGSNENKANIFVFDPMDENTCVMSPLKWGTPLQITDRIMSSFEFPDPYYKAIQSEALLTIVTLISAAKEEVTFKRIDQLLRDMEALTMLSEKVPDRALSLKLRAILGLKDQERMSQFSGVLSQISPFVTGEIAELVNGIGEGSRRELSLSSVLTREEYKPNAALILIPTLMYPEVGRVLGRMCLQEIAYSVGKRSSHGSTNLFASVFLDEFSSYAYPGFEQILNKARSAKIALHLSHQSTGDLEAVSPEFAKVVNTNTNIKCLLGLNDPDTADFFARHMGTETNLKFTERVEEKDNFFGSKNERTGSKSMRETEAYKIHPNRLKNLNAGEGVIHIPGKPDAVTEEIQFYDLDSLGIHPANNRAVI